MPHGKSLSKQQAIRKRIDNLDIIKIKKRASKSTINKVERQPTQWKGIFANHKELVSGIHKSKPLNRVNPVKTVGQGFEQTFIQR